MYVELLVKPEMLTSYIYGPTFGKAESRLFLFGVQCFNTESMQNALLDCRRTAAIKKRVTAVLRSIPKEAFADSFQKLYERCQPCVVKDGDYFEGQ
jgi:hypothetical protein